MLKQTLQPGIVVMIDGTAAPDYLESRTNKIMAPVPTATTSRGTGASDWCLANQPKHGHQCGSPALGNLKVYLYSSYFVRIRLCQTC